MYHMNKQIGQITDLFGNLNLTTKELKPFDRSQIHKKGTLFFISNKKSVFGDTVVHTGT